ncbi:hypothetical protein HYT95_02330 [Candidatus Peregrinibacteria bacterium]|nr:hypothetical protein [Candidatus Peregrinibacteria bacterium]
MHLLALDTDITGVKRRFLSANEQEVLTVFRHGFSFFLQTILQVVLTIGLIATGVALNMWDIFPWDIPSWWIMGFLALLWIFLAFPTILKAFLDWKFDFIFVTTEKVVIVDQSSLFHQKTTPMTLENFASVTAATQFWNIFPFGALHFQLKEGIGEDITTKYIPQAHDVAAKIADTITLYQRRFMEQKPSS